MSVVSPEGSIGGYDFKNKLSPASESVAITWSCQTVNPRTKNESMRNSSPASANNLIN